MRIRGVSADGTDLSHLIPTLEKQFSSVGLTLKEDNNTFKSTYDNMKDLSTVWKDLTDMQRADILESVAGKRQGQVVAAMINNFNAVEKSLESAKNSMGSAQAEFERAMDSIAFKSNRLSETLTRFWQNLISRDFIKDFVDSLYITTNMLDNLINNSISSFIIQVGVMSTSLNLLRKVFLSLGNSTVIYTIKQYALMASTQGLLVTMKALTATLLASPLFWIVGATATIYAIAKSIDYLTVSLKEQKEIVYTLSNELKNLQSDYDNLKNSSDLTEEQEKYLKLLEREIQLKKESLAIETKKAIKQEFTTKRPTMLNAGMGKPNFANNKQYKPISGIDKIEEKINDFKKLKEELLNLRNLEDEIKFDKLNEQINELEQSLVNSRKTIHGYIEILGSDIPPELLKLTDAIDEVVLKTDEQSDSIEGNYGSIDETILAVDRYATALQKLEEVEEKATKGASLSYEEKEKLLDTYPNLEDAIYRTADGWAVEKNALQDLRKSIKETELAQIEAEKNKSEIVWKSAKDRIGIFVTEATTYNEFLKSLVKNNVSGVNKSYGSLYKAIDIGEETEAEKYIKQFKTYQDLLQAAKDAEEKINDISVGGIGGNSSRSRRSSKSSFDKQFQTLKNNISDISYEIDTLNEKLAQSEGLNKIPILEAINEKYIEQQKALHKINNARREELAKLSPTSEEYIKLKKDIQDASLNYIKLDTAIQSNIKSMAELNDEVARNNLELNKKIARKYYDDKLELLNTQKDALKEILDLTIEMIKKEKEDAIDALKDKLDAYKDIIDARKKELRLAKEESDYRDELADKEKSVSDIQNQLAELAYDNSLSTQAKRLKLAEELAEAQNELDDLQAERSLEIQEDALDEEYEKYEEIIDDKTSKLEDYLSDNKQLTEDAMNLMEDHAESLYDKLLDFNSTYGDSIQSDIVSAWEEATEALEKYKSVSNAFDRINSEIDDSSDASDLLDDNSDTLTQSEINSIIAIMKSNSRKWHSADEETRKALHASNMSLADKIGASYNSRTGKYYLNGVPLYAKGTTSASGGLSIVGEEGAELRVLNQGDGIIPSDLTNKLISLAQNPLNYMSGLLPTKLAVPTRSSNFNTSFGDINFTIAGADKKSAKSIADEVIKAINTTQNLRGNNRKTNSFGQ